MNGWCKGGCNLFSVSSTYIIMGSDSCCFFVCKFSDTVVEIGVAVSLCPSQESNTTVGALPNFLKTIFGAFIVGVLLVVVLQSVMTGG